MRVSFVIPAHDEERLIGATVGALAAAVRELRLDAEIVVACDGCTDGTREAAERAGARTVVIDKRQIAAARNAGWKATTGDVLVFVDADTIVPVASVAEALQAIERGAVGGGAAFMFDGPLPLYARAAGSLMRGVTRAMRLTGGCFLFCKRDALEKAGGWDETLFVSEEIALARAIKKEGRFVIVRTPVHTSGRKVRTYSGGEILSLFLRAAVRPGMVRDRSALGLWYGPRRNDPHEAHQSQAHAGPSR